MSENVANKDEALKCLGIARRSLVEGDAGKAERFAQKALRLYRCQEVEAFLVELSVAGRQNGHAPSSSQTSTPAHHTRSHNQSTPHSTKSSSQHRSEPAANGSTHAESTRQRKHAAAAHGATANGSGPQLPKRGSDANGGVSTPEQRALVLKILKAKDFYEILDVPKDAGDDDIKRAYRKLALKLHPDKNAAPKAEDAFKAVSKAFSCLSDANKRAYYDRTGYETRDAAAAATPSRRGSAGGFGGGFPGGMYGGGGDDFDAEELFNMFFGGSPFNPRSQVFRQHGGMPRRQAQPNQQHQYTQQAPADQQRNAWVGLLQLLPVMLLLALTFFGGSSEPTYALAREGRFQQPMITQRLQVPFFVKSIKDFERSHPLNTHVRTALERQVENEYYERVTLRCQQERMTQHRLSIWGKRDQAKAMKMPACDELESMNEKLGVGNKRHRGY